MMFMKVINKILYLNGINFVHNTNLYCMNEFYKGKTTNLNKQKIVLNSEFRNSNIFRCICHREIRGYENIRRENNGNEIKSNRLFDKVRSNLILRKTFDHLFTRHKLNIINYNKI